MAKPKLTIRESKLIAQFLKEDNDTQHHRVADIINHVMPTNKNKERHAAFIKWLNENNHEYQVYHAQDLWNEFIEQYFGS